MKLECSCGGIAFETRQRKAYRGDATACRSCKQPGHISVTDDYEDDAVASWHLDSECSSGPHCDSIMPKPTPAPGAGEQRKGEE